MNEKCEMMMNMAKAISRINNADIERLDLQKIHMGGDGKFDFYVLIATYSDGKEITIRQDCTIVEN